MQDYAALNHQEAVALRRAMCGHDLDPETGRCACGHLDPPADADDREEHLLEIAFRAGEIHGIMTP